MSFRASAAVVIRQTPRFDCWQVEGLFRGCSKARGTVKTVPVLKHVVYHDLLFNYNSFTSVLRFNREKVGFSMW